jgi:hypothetical protein
MTSSASGKAPVSGLPVLEGDHGCDRGWFPRCVRRCPVFRYEYVSIDTVAREIAQGAVAEGRVLAITVDEWMPPSLHYSS